MSAAAQSTSIGAILLLLALCTSGISAQPADLIPLVEQPVAPRGGVMMLPVAVAAADTASAGSGRTAPRDAPHREPLAIPAVTDDAGRTLRAEAVWFRPRDRSDARPLTWTCDPRDLRLSRSRRQDDDTAVLLIDLPDDGEGPLRIGSRLLHPIWVTPAQPSIPDPFDIAAEGTLRIERGHHRPDPDQPLEHFRWVLLADELGLVPPGTERFDAEERRVAEASADLWRIGLARLARISPGVARACRRALVYRVYDDDVEIAAWVADPELLDELLRILLDPTRSERRLLSDALTWSDLVPPLIAWLDDHDADSVTLAMINRSPRPISVTTSFEFGREPPTETTLPIGRVARLRLERPRTPETDTAAHFRPEGHGHGTGAVPVVLRIEATAQLIRMQIPPPFERAVPPGALLSPFLPPLTLHDLDRGVPPMLIPERATSGELRFRQGRWELFFECRRPVRPAAHDGAGLPEDATSARDLRGTEALTVSIGPAHEPYAVLAVPEQGWWRLLRGSNDGSLQVHRRTLDDRWYCRIVLPADWLRITGDTPFAKLSAVRTHRGTPAFETMPRSGPPWQSRHPTRNLDLFHWDGLP